jgi:GT2 family glycosyltransferase
VRLLPLYAAITAANRLPSATSQGPLLASSEWRPGVSVVIPERDAPDLLARALQSIHDALAEVGEPSQIIVVVNGAPMARYDEIAARFAAVQMLHSDQPLGFSAAIHQGVSVARYDWTFLMNNDMTVDRHALLELARLRDGDVFAVASQIFQRSADGRREETGFTDWYVNAEGVHVFHADPGDALQAREHLCASGGAGLFRTAPLRTFAGDSRCYDPFYWEDVEWGVRAQRAGMRVLFCPRSHAHHLHRMSTTRFFTEAEVARIVERNRILFDLRNGATDFGVDWLMQRVCDLDYQAQRKFAGSRLAAQVFRHRRVTGRGRLTSPPCTTHPTRDFVELSSSYSYRLRAASSDGPPRPVVLLATPFCVFPARHGGARRIQGLLRSLKRDFDIVLVTDEASLYDARSFADFDALLAVYLVQRPTEPDARAADDIARRMETHCHPALMEAMRAALLRYAPEIVQIEYAELSLASSVRSAGERWVLGLHDAYASTDFAAAADAAQFHDNVERTYDAVTVCSSEDQALATHRHVVCVPNASSIEPGTYLPSRSLQLLFMGPFRYTQNFLGIRSFLADCYPAIANAITGVGLLILGGDGARARVAADPLFAQSGVHVMDYRDDVAGLLASCALTINPLVAIRGSSIKVIESLVAGRVCVTTRDGARGFASEGLPGLIAVHDIAAMSAPIIALMRDPARRHVIEQPDAAKFARYRWEYSAAIQANLYRSLLEAKRG